MPAGESRRCRASGSIPRFADVGWRRRPSPPSSIKCYVNDTVSLYVNTRALACYRHVGFETIDEFATVLYKRWGLWRLCYPV